jgi:hypothetical protein
VVAQSVQKGAQHAIGVMIVLGCEFLRELIDPDVRLLDAATRGCAAAVG